MKKGFTLVELLATITILGIIALLLVPTVTETCLLYTSTFQIPNGNYSGTVTEDSSIKEYLNDTYYPTLTGIEKTQVQSHSFNLGSVQALVESGNDSIEKKIAGEKMYQWTGNRCV